MYDGENCKKKYAWYVGGIKHERQKKKKTEGWMKFCDQVVIKSIEDYHSGEKWIFKFRWNDHMILGAEVSEKRGRPFPGVVAD